jgi:hypothetical protein
MGNNAYTLSALLEPGLSILDNLGSVSPTLEGIFSGAGCDSGGCGSGTLPSTLATYGPIMPPAPGPNYRGPGFPEFPDLRCKVCTCEEWYKGGPWGCFTPEELAQDSKLRLCVAGLFDCNTCDRCPGMPPLPNTTPWWPELDTEIHEGGIRKHYEGEGGDKSGWPEEWDEERWGLDHRNFGWIFPWIKISKDHPCARKSPVPFEMGEDFWALISACRTKLGNCAGAFLPSCLAFCVSKGATCQILWAACYDYCTSCATQQQWGDCKACCDGQKSWCNAVWLVEGQICQA